MRSAIRLFFVWTLSGVAVADPDEPAGCVACPETPTPYDANATLPPGTKFDHPEVVRIRVVIDPEGRVVDTRVVKSTNPAFDGIAVAAVRKWKYRKREVHDGPACIESDVEMKFEP